MKVMKTDRRNSQRLRMAGDGCKIFIPDHSMIGSVLDVGEGGLSFEYTPCYSILGEGSEMEIYFHDGFRLHVPPLRCRIAYDRPDRSKGSYYRIFEIRRCGAVFRDGRSGIPASMRQFLEGGGERQRAMAMKRGPEPNGAYAPMELKPVGQ
jgi:hypothetical protein